MTLTTEVHCDAVLAAMSAENAPVVLVGHSFGGITISNVAEAGPEKIKALIYLSTYPPQDGQSMLDLAQTDLDSLLGKPVNLVLAPDYSVASIKEDQKADIFTNDASDSDREAIVASLIAESGAPQGIPVKLTEDRFGHVPKFYVETTGDNCVSPYLQEQMIAHAGVAAVTRIEAGHASYITQPATVADAILAAAA